MGNILVPEVSGDKHRFVKMLMAVTLEKLFFVKLKKLEVAIIIKTIKIH